MKIPIIAMALLVLSTPLLADEVWVCTFPGRGTNAPPQARYWLHNKTLQEIEIPYELYDVLVDDDLAIVAASGEAIEGRDIGFVTGRHPNVIIQTTTLAINRKTGDAVYGAVALYGPRGGLSPIPGTCHRQTSQEHDAVWPPGMQNQTAPAPDAQH